MKKAQLIVIVEKALFHDEENHGWHIDAFDETAIKAHNERYGTNYVAGQLSKAESMTLEIASMRSVVKTEYCISQNWLREQVIRGYYGGYGGLVQPPPFYEGLHLEVKTAIEKALLLVDFDAVKQGKKFEINIYY